MASIAGLVANIFLTLGLGGSGLSSSCCPNGFANLFTGLLGAGFTSLTSSCYYPKGLEFNSFLAGLGFSASNFALSSYSFFNSLAFFSSAFFLSNAFCSSNFLRSAAFLASSYFFCSRALAS
jgi:hypothetical protein